MGAKGRRLKARCVKALVSFLVVESTGFEFDNENSKSKDQMGFVSL